MIRTDPDVSLSPVVTQVFEQLLAEMMSGELAPGQRINDAELAERFGVSRTPVREAIQRLRNSGLIEASASRFTRVAAVTPEQTNHAYTVWKALYPLLLEETIPLADDETVALLEADRAEFLAAIPNRDNQRLAGANFRFFSRLQALSSNAVLVRSLVTVVHTVRLGSLYLPRPLDLEPLERAQALLVEAARHNDQARADEAMNMLRSVVVPLD